MSAPSRATAVGFDLGETLFTYADTPLSWVDHYRPALGQVARVCGVELTPERATVGCDWLARHNTRLNPRPHEIAADVLFDEILRGWGVDPSVSLRDALTEFFLYFQQRLAPYPETSDALRSLQKQGFRIGALTDVPYGMPEDFVQQDLTRAGVAGFLDVVLTSVGVGRRKPEAEGFCQLASRLNISTERLWYVGNERKDIAGANAAGAISVLIDRQNARTDWGQRYTISSLSELSPLLEQG